MEHATANDDSAAKTALDAPSDQSLRVPCYCEENVWRLAYRMLNGKTKSSSKEYYVVFLSNPMQCVPMFHQLAVKDPSKPCYWDYHVILISYSEKDKPAAQVLDMDSHLPYPCGLETYLSSVFPTEIQWPDEYLPYFRVVDAQVFVDNFCSDRSHMYDKEKQQWNAPPPLYSCILPSEKTNLSQYMTIDMNEIERQLPDGRGEKYPFGAIYSLLDLRKRFLRANSSKRRIE